jgi:hypothetical protein
MSDRIAALTSLGRVGAFVANLSRFTIDQNKTIGCEFERMGYRSLSFGESLGREAFTQAAISPPPPHEDQEGSRRTG